MAVNFDIKNADKFLLKIPYKSLLFMITIISASLLFLPDNILEKMFLIDLRNLIGTYLGITFIVCLLAWVIIVLKWIWEKIDEAITFSDKNCKKRFKKISEEAIELVLMMYSSRSHSMRMDMTKANVEVLENCCFIGRGSVSVGGMTFDYYLQPWVVRYLDKHISEYAQLVNKR